LDASSGSEDEITPQLVDQYETAAGRRVAWVYFSHNWYRSREFPLDKVNWISARGAVPFIRLMLRSSSDNPTPDPEFTLSNINNGRYDSDIRAWAVRAREFARPLIVEWGTEVNGQWFAWNAKWNGEEQGAERFRNAYRRIVNIMRNDGHADNITWVFHGNDNDDPETSWNTLERYYPGDDFVDWLGMSVYGAQMPFENEDCPPFSQRAIELHNRLHSIARSKPIFLLEFGATLNHPNANTDPQCDAAGWADTALREVLERNNLPMLHGFSWWNETWENDEESAHNTDMRLQSSSALRNVFRRHLVGNARIGERF
jgi:hypothetical protein